MTNQNRRTSNNKKTLEKIEGLTHRLNKKEELFYIVFSFYQGDLKNAKIIRKIKRARAAINNEKLAISTRQKQLITAQIAAMTSYSSILEMRIEDLNRDDDLRKFDD